MKREVAEQMQKSEKMHLGIHGYYVHSHGLLPTDPKYTIPKNKESYLDEV